MTFKHSVGDKIGFKYQDKWTTGIVQGFHKSEPDSTFDSYVVKLENGEVTWILPSEIYMTYSKVRIIRAGDMQAREDLVGQKGTIIGVNTNGATGNTESDPLFTVITENDEVDQFWLDELIHIGE